MLTISWGDAVDLRRFERAVAGLTKPQIGRAGSRALNRAGAQARTKARRALAGQTGLKQKLLNRAMRVKRASVGNLEYRISSHGGDISLKYFAARETAKGVSANPFGKRRVYLSTFIKGGRFPKRKDIGLNGQVFLRSGAARLPMDKQKSGVVIPAEMVKGASAKAWQSSVGVELPRRLKHEIARLTGGVLS